MNFGNYDNCVFPLKKLVILGERPKIQISIISNICLSVGPVSETPYHTHYWEVEFLTQSIGYIGL